VPAVVGDDDRAGGGVLMGDAPVVYVVGFAGVFALLAFVASTDWCGWFGVALALRWGGW
jgi:hypothetical protein